MQCFLMPDPFVFEIIVPADVTITCSFIHRRCFTKGYQALQLKNVHVRRPPWKEGEATLIFAVITVKVGGFTPCSSLIAEIRKGSCKHHGRPL